MAQPASERTTHRWLQTRNGLGELLGVDFETASPMRLYRASDVLVKHCEAIDAHLFDRARTLRGIRRGSGAPKSGAADIHVPGG